MNNESVLTMRQPIEANKTEEHSFVLYIGQRGAYPIAEMSNEEKKMYQEQVKLRQMSDTDDFAEELCKHLELTRCVMRD